MSRPIRLAVVADGDPNSPRTNSGVARGLLDALRQRSDVEICATIDSSPSRAESILLTTLSWHPKVSTWRNQKRKGRLATALRSRKRDRVLSSLDIEPDVVLHIRNTYLPAREPYVVFVDGTASLSQRYWADWRLSRRAYRRRVAQERAFFGEALLVATAGAHAAREVVEFYEQSPDRVVAVGGGTNLDVRSSGARESGERDSAVQFLFVGKEFARKGGPELLAAFAVLRAQGIECGLIVVGPDAPSVVPPGVDWRGFVGDRDELSDIYQSADVFCLPSRYEPYGLVVQEALANGLPCLVSDRGALPEIVGDAGLVVDVDSVDAIASAMKMLAQDAELRRSLARHSRDRLDELTWNRVAERLLTGIARARLQPDSSRTKR